MSLPLALVWSVFIAWVAFAERRANPDECVVALTTALWCFGNGFWTLSDFAEWRDVAARDASASDYAGSGYDGGGGVTDGAPLTFTPAGMLRKVLRDSPHGRDVEAVVDSLAAELKRRFASRRQTLRDRKVCITWRGVATNLSTMSRANTVDVSTALAMPDDDFDVALDALLAVGSGDFSLKEKGTTGVFLANAGWSSRGSHLP